jgi:GTP-binding protein
LQFFSIEDKVIFVDLPGYGYAKNPDASWDDVISTYLKNSPHLKILLLLIDSRHPPTALDLQMMEWIEAMHIRCIVVLTKCDKLTLSQCQTQTKMILSTLSPAEPLPFVNYSIESGDGRKKLLTLIGQSL